MKSRWEESEIIHKKKMAVMLLAAAVFGTVGTAEASWLSGVISKIEQKVDSYGSGQSVLREPLEKNEHMDQYGFIRGEAVTTKANADELIAERSFEVKGPTRVGLKFNRGGEAVIKHWLCNERDEHLFGPLDQPYDRPCAILSKGRYKLKTYIRATNIGAKGTYSLLPSFTNLDVNQPSNITSMEKAEPIQFGVEVRNIFPARTEKERKVDVPHYYTFQLYKESWVELSGWTYIFFGGEYMTIRDTQGNLLEELHVDFDPPSREWNARRVQLQPGTYYVKVERGKYWKSEEAPILPSNLPARAATVSIKDLGKYEGGRAYGFTLTILD